MREKLISVDSPKLENLRTIGLFQIISCSNFREVDLKVYNSSNDYYQLSFHSNICFVCIKETSYGDVSFTHTKYMFLKITFKIVHR